MSKVNQKGQALRSSGQALLIVLLSLSVVLTLVLFILSRSITDIAVSTSGEEAIRAFSAAEAGVERALVIGASSDTLGNASFNASVTSFGEGADFFNYPLNLASGDSATFWFSSHDTSGNLICDATHPCFTGNTIKVCWGNPSTSDRAATTPAVEVSVFYADGIGRKAYDPNISRRSSNAFAANDLGACKIGDVDYAFSKIISLSDFSLTGALKFARVRFFYNTTENHKLGLDVSTSGDTLPSQGSLITSTGISGDSNRQLEVFQGFPEAPLPFDFAVYSPTGLTK